MNGALVDLACLSFGFKIIPIPLNSTCEHASYIINHSEITHLFIGGENAEQIWNDIRHSHDIDTIAMSDANQITNYSIEELIGKQVVAVCNFGKKNIAGIESEVLILGAINKNKEVILLHPQQKVDNGSNVC